MDHALDLRVQKFVQEVDGISRVKRIEKHVGKSSDATATAELLERPSSEAPLRDR